MGAYLTGGSVNSQAHIAQGLFSVNITKICDICLINLLTRELVGMLARGGKV